MILFSSLGSIKEIAKGDFMDNVNILLESLISNLKEGIHIVDSKGKTIHYNHAMENIEGMKSEDVMGKEIQEYLRDIEHSTILESLKSGHTYRDTIQNYSNGAGKIITSVNSTIPVMVDGKVEAVIEIARDMTQIKKLNETICQLENKSKSKKNYYTFNDIIGSSKVLNEEILKSKKASISNSSVLIYGETGCGKELFAQGIHYEGIRRDKPFIAINCAAIPSALLEGMLFGTVKGSFTGAENKKGLFEEADKGTIFLDEISEISMNTQAKLLRVLQEKEIMRVGSNHSVCVDVRVIAATNADLTKAVKEGRFREDLFYRLNILPILIPPLRERKEDISLLIKNFIVKFNDEYGRHILNISDDALNILMNYEWPGNVRELENIVGRSIINMNINERVIQTEHLPQLFSAKKPQADNCVVAKMEELTELSKVIDKAESDYIKNVYYKLSKSKTETAKVLGISLRSLYYKMEKYGIS